MLPFNATVDAKAIAEALRFEARLRPMYRTLPRRGQPWFRLLDGPSSVLATAPHATAAMRHGRIRGPDTGTGWLAWMLHRLAGVSVLYTTRASPSDPNYYDDNAFKRRLAVRLRHRRPLSHSDLPWENLTHSTL